MELTVIEKANILGMELRIYGDKDRPLFLARDIAERINYDLNKVNEMLKLVDDIDEKLNTKISWSGQRRDMWFLTEEGVYSVIMKSNLDKAKEFRKGLKEFLRAWRKGTVKVLESKALSQAEFLLHQAQIMLEQERKLSQLEVATTVIKSDVQRLENNIRRASNTQQLTVIAYANLHGISHRSYFAPALGKRATKLCKEKNLLTGTIVDSRFGVVKTYPEEVLDIVFENIK